MFIKDSIIGQELTELQSDEHRGFGGISLSNIPWANFLSDDKSGEEKLATFTDIIDLGLNILMPGKSIRVYPTDLPGMNAEINP